PERPGGRQGLEERADRVRILVHQRGIGADGVPEPPPSGHTPGLGERAAWSLVRPLRGIHAGGSDEYPALAARHRRHAFRGRRGGPGYIRGGAQDGMVPGQEQGRDYSLSSGREGGRPHTAWHTRNSQTKTRLPLGLKIESIRKLPLSSMVNSDRLLPAVPLSVKAIIPRSSKAVTVPFLFFISMVNRFSRIPIE